MSSPKPARTRTSPLRAFAPGGGGAGSYRQEEDEDEKGVAESNVLEEDEEEPSEMTDSLRDLVSIKAYYIDKNSPDFQAKYDSVSLVIC